MVWATIVLFLFVASLVVLYFLPYKMLRGKIFSKVFSDVSSLDALTYTNRYFSVSFKREDNQWFITTPTVWQADSVKMRKLVLRLGDVDIVDRLKLGTDLDDRYALGRNGTLELHFGNKVVTVELGGLRENGEQLYISKSGDKDIVVTSATLLAVLPKDMEDFKRYILFEEYYGSITSVEGSFNGQGYLMVRIGSGWIVNGKNVFEEKAQAFIEGVLELSAEDMAPQGFKLPPKHEGLITIKAGRKGISRYFFRSEEYEGKYLVPLEGEILIADEAVVEKFAKF